MAQPLRRFIDWMADYTLAPRGMALRMGLRMGEPGPERERVGVRRAGPPPQRMTPARARVLRSLADGMVRSKAEIAQEAGVSAGVVNGLIDEGTLETLVLPPEPVAMPPDPAFAVPDLSPAQQEAADGLRETVCAGAFSVTLVDGVTGSGKTEVYFEAVAEAVRLGRQVADPDAGDRADRAIPGTLRAPFRRATRRMAFAGAAAPPGADLDARWRRARCRWWRGRARRCSCRSAISA